MRSFALWITLTTMFCSYELYATQHYKGTVLSVQKYNLVNRPAPYIQFILNENGTEHTIELGPEWYISEQGVTFSPGDEVEVEGDLIDSSEKGSVIQARLIKKGGAQLRLTQKDGSLPW